jgi:signal transduction histidine kinase
MQNHNTQTITKLQRENNKLKKELQRQNDFISISIHDLLNPLNIAMVWTDMLKQSLQAKEKLSTKEKAKTKEYHKKIRKALDRLYNLIKIFFDVQKFDHNSIELELKEIDLLNLLTEIYSNQFQLLKKENIKLTFKNKLNTKKLPIKIDKTRLQQVFENLISNATKFVPKDGTGIITIQIEKTNKNQIKISITDNGCGVPKKEQKNIFQKFVSQGQKKSTGLGLYISHKIVELHGGKIWCENSDEGGAQFCMEMKQAISDK